ncbi:MAG: S-methyl-5'-thioadenosine phosphorylase [Deltaproteobacteria bacterium]|nr:S-methyl-5'-thioadenosine phosphorylase [Deltaproteobacteria bacterium]MDH4122003.1 S-methyl-5'-thioadenosine phosphorylase [Deltaproteobacteria bacterium]
MMIGIIGGSGLYNLDGMEDLREVTLTTPFGNPSGPYTTGRLHGRPVAFLARHGAGHRLTPSEIPYKANIWGLKKLGATHLIAISAVGSLKESIEPGHIVFPDQFIDRTRLRDSTFFGRGVVAHVQFGDPVCPHLFKQLVSAGKQVGAVCHPGGTYLCMEGPAFSTRAESNLYRSWGASVIGMTNLQEAKLAREAELCFGTIALSTDYDCWHESNEQVTIEAVLEVMRKNVETAKRILAVAIAGLGEDRPCPCPSAVKNAIVTPPDRIPRETLRDLEPILGKYIPSV